MTSFAQAATLGTIQGDVRVNQGQGFKPATGSAELKVGDAVMASPGGKAQIAYADGCLINVAAGVVASVTDKSPCAIAKAEFPKPSYQSGGGGGDAIGANLIVPAVLIAAAVGIVVLASQGNGGNSPPSSP